MDSQIVMAQEEINLVRNLVGREIDSLKVIGVDSSNGETDYTRILERLEEKFSVV